ncbi:class I SAM-dependent rRNA methyltransferase [Parachlamydia sp. AcF125]|uniref:class I SAM-dependent rRNA methyltransferase n=1 Tax=Parachlamydia sp. AcF125 TaxID=2795736 RepID=UPI001BCA11D3|nr:class I SAM-dependent rRNA methyltransferase [Parachlamydia sp. AcF125]MBS4168405.1 Ribosomal RNA large subunit methyltransferase I [Parachlamydia sp. AcF125]
MKQKRVILKPGKEKAILHHHHWIFSGAIASSPSYENGEILPVYASNQTLLGQAYFNKHSSIAGRMVAFGEVQAENALRENLERAIQFRKRWFQGQSTTAYRLVNGEGDCLPGLIVDQYADNLVLQISTLGMERLKGVIVSELERLLSPQLIYEKSLLPSRKEEGLEPFQGVLKGHFSKEVEILENGLRFKVSLVHGQKTGFFLDHREMRQQIRQLALQKRVLNCFSYTGGFSVYAAAGGAKRVDSVDISEKAIQDAKINMKLNPAQCTTEFYCEDVFEFLRSSKLDYDLVILDPPAFAKKKSDQISACRAYKDINRLAMQKMPRGSLLLTSSCSYFVDENLFQKVVFQACEEAKRSAKIIGRHHLAPDHPVNLAHPEGDYLKSLLLFLN